ncbi:Hypothetical protein LUCI_4727 [Lucifera butyrica]|uniref:Uncharacterized protein n=2 Tax=Lucifera butyrica TaxID=1351585 RepID=A0A498RER7_9FIRM|nr:Hypothetical protein LUCI_4727 [Lucifera butyrica]
MKINSIQLTIDQKPGQIGIHTTPGNLNLHTAQPDLRLHTQAAELQLHTVPAEVMIDMQPSFNSMGLQDLTSFGQSNAQDAQQAISRAVSVAVEQGKKYAVPHGERVGKIVADAVQERRPDKQLVISNVPSVPPAISVQLGRVEGRYIDGRVATNFKQGEVRGNFTWGKVDVYMEQEPYVDIKA